MVTQSRPATPAHNPTIILLSTKQAPPRLRRLRTPPTLFWLNLNNRNFQISALMDGWSAGRSCEGWGKGKVANVGYWNTCHGSIHGHWNTCHGSIRVGRWNTCHSSIRIGHWNTCHGSRENKRKTNNFCGKHLFIRKWEIKRCVNISFLPTKDFLTTQNILPLLLSHWTHLSPPSVCGQR